MAVAKPRPFIKLQHLRVPEAGPRYQLINGDLDLALRRTGSTF